ncbi:hypothetical protein Trydic_g18562 [Trypoxylus dichotomus]
MKGTEFGFQLDKATDNPNFTVSKLPTLLAIPPPLSGLGTGNGIEVLLNPPPIPMAELVPRIWRNKYISKESKVRIYKAMVRPVLTYSTETRGDTKKMKILRKIANVTLRDTQTSKSTKKICGIQDVVKWSKRRRLAVHLQTQETKRKETRDKEKPSAGSLGLGRDWIFQQENDSKHTIRLAKDWVLYYAPRQLCSPPQWNMFSKN